MDPVQERYKLLHRPWTASAYYDHPDGEDLFGKLSYTTKFGAMAGLIIGTFMTKSYKPPLTTTKAKLFKIFSHTAMGVAVPAAFTIVTYYSTRLRKKDDEKNYALGGAAAGAVLAPFLGCFGAVFFALAFSGGAFWHKSAMMSGVSLFGGVEGKRYMPSYFLKTYDFSLLPQQEKTWTKDP